MSAKKPPREPELSATRDEDDDDPPPQISEDEAKTHDEIYEKHVAADNPELIRAIARAKALLEAAATKK